jgi:acyl dehydratase
MADRYFYDFKIGDRFETASLEVTEHDILAFASSFDPQAWHLDPEAAAASPFKGLVASGWHTTAITMRLIVDSGFLKATGVLGSGIDELRWVRPVRPGDVLRVAGEIVALEPPQSGRSAGTVRVRLATIDQRGETVMSEVAILRVPVRPRNA